jgi:hypothetical protein
MLRCFGEIRGSSALRAAAYSADENVGISSNVLGIAVISVKDRPGFPMLVQRLPTTEWT